MAEKKICEVCGREFEESYAGFCSERCFEQDFWTKALDKDAIIVNGVCYHMGDENEKSYFRGFGGARFVIEFLSDGHRVTTTNLWCQGDIPERFYKSDNAVFVKNS